MSALLALAVCHAEMVPALSTHGLPLARLGTILIASFLPVVGTLTLKATQPAALSTTLLIALGKTQTKRAVLSITISVVLMVIIGEPTRRVRTRQMGAGC